MTCVTGAARDVTAAPHDARPVHAHADADASVDAVAVALVADAPGRPTAVPVVRCAVRAVAAAAVVRDDGPWLPGCSWSDCRAQGSKAASDSWDKRSADATRSLQSERARERREINA